MKLQIISLLSISFIYLSKCQNIISPTGYTLSYLENIDMLQMKCTVDSDCPQYSKCETIINGNKTYSICKFGDFLCPEKAVDYYTKLVDSDDTCSYVDSNIYDFNEEAVKESFSKAIKPILKICPNNDSDCTTDKCTKNSDCLSGVCLNNSCVNNGYMVHDIYRCSVNDEIDTKYTMKCKKVNGMSCGNDSECYSNVCTKYGVSKYCVKTKPKAYGNDIIIISGLILLIIVFISIFASICCRKNK